ncbi:MAG: DUF2950 family protein [Holophagales bacterium]|nr:DUF2950 family protein [Holophagales bacterium]
MSPGRRSRSDRRRPAAPGLARSRTRLRGAGGPPILDARARLSRSPSGLVREKDLGPGSLDAFRAMERFDPDESWHPVEN